MRLQVSHKYKAGGIEEIEPLLRHAYVHSFKVYMRFCVNVILWVSAGSNGEK